MGKYQLVASHYDSYRKEFLNEIVVNMPDIDLTILSNIDHFTSSNNIQKIMEEIKKHNNITNQNMLSIRYYKNMVNNYNLRDLDLDKEEFIEVSELDQMGYKK